MSDGSLRRAAILIASLDTASADALLNEMSPDQAASIRNAVMELGDIDIVEQQEVVGQFVGNQTGTTGTDDAGVEIAPELARKFGSDTNSETVDQPADEEPEHQKHKKCKNHQKHQDTPPFAFLEEVDAYELARALSGEHPQTAAIVTAHLSPARAAEVIGHLPAQQQTETLMRVARLAAPHPDIIRDLENEMQALLANRSSREQVGAEGLARVEAILQSTSSATRQNLVAHLAQKDQLLVGQLRFAARRQGSDAVGTTPPTMPAPFERPVSSGQHLDRPARVDFPSEERLAAASPTLEFADLEQLDSSALAQVLHRCSSNTTLLALAGASHQFVQQILSQLPTREAAQLQRKIQQIGPLRLDDVERAQQQLACIAEQLAAEGTLVVPGKQRLSVAA